MELNKHLGARRPSLSETFKLLWIGFVLFDIYIGQSCSCFRVVSLYRLIGSYMLDLLPFCRVSLRCFDHLFVLFYFFYLISKFDY